MKKIFIIIIFIFLINIVIAKHTTTTSVNPDSGYETTNIEINMSITNTGNKAIINTTIFFNNFVLIDIPNSTEYINYTNTSDTIVCSVTIYPDSTQEFKTFIFQTPLVNENITFNWTVQTIDDKDDIYNNTIEIIAVNDISPPSFSNILPENGSVIQELELFSINVLDEQTGIKNVTLSYCNTESIEICNSSELIELNCTNNICNTTLNFSDYLDSSFINYRFNITNNANGINSSGWYYAQIDKVAPSIILEAPEDNKEFNQNESFNFTFRAVDNLASNLECSLIISDVIVKSATIPNNVSSNFTYTITESGNWRINCSDEIGLANSSEIRSFSIYVPPAEQNEPSQGGGSDSPSGSKKIEEKPVKQPEKQVVIPPSEEIVEIEEEVIPKIETSEGKKGTLDKFTGFVSYNLGESGMGLIGISLFTFLASFVMKKLEMIKGYNKF